MTSYLRLKATRENFLEEVTNYCLLGATDAILASFFQTDQRTIEEWYGKYEDFTRAVRQGREEADLQVIKAMHKRATGYEYERQQVVITNGHGEAVSLKEHIPPDTAAGKFWLTNRRKREWKDKQSIELGGRDGRPIETEIAIKFIPPTGDGTPKLTQPEPIEGELVSANDSSLPPPSAT